MSAIDAAVRYWPPLVDVLGDAHVVEVPLEIYPFDGDGATWRDAETQDRLVPRFADDWRILDVTWCRPPFAKTVFLNPAEESFMFVSEVPVDTMIEPAAVHLFAWAVRVWVFVIYHNRVMCCFAERILAKHRDNRLACAYTATSAAEAGPHVAIMNKYLGIEYPGVTQRDAESFDVDYQNTRLGCIAALALINCKNVVAVHRPPTRQALRYARRWNLPVYRYHKLRLAPRSARGRAMSASGLDMAIHWVRGHFKEYGTRGLFGKHRGVYWWTPHLAGTAARVVDKDYVIPAAPRKRGMNATANSNVSKL